MENKKVPAIQDIYEGNLDKLQKQNELNILVNQPPKDDWIKERDGIPYLPIERVEFLLTYIFINWWVEIKEVKLIANSVCVTVKLHYTDPVSGQTKWQDGIGAVPIQLNAGSNPTDFSAMKSNAIQLGAPAAESFATKDAAEKIGKLFGKDVARKNQLNYTENLANKFSEVNKLKKELSKQLDHCQDEELKAGIMAATLSMEEANEADEKFYKSQIEKLTNRPS